MHNEEPSPGPRAVGKGAPAYGSGRSESLPSGYVRVWRPGHVLAGADGYVYEHRLICWEHGVDPRGLEVHHRNEDRSDNGWQNLVIKTPSDHHAEHHQVGAMVRNQYGTFAVLTDAQRLEKSRAKSRENQRKRRAGLRFDRSTGVWAPGVVS